jgi:hypothetical protein
MAKLSSKHAQAMRTRANWLDFSKFLLIQVKLMREMKDKGWSYKFELQMRAK